MVISTNDGRSRADQIFMDRFPDYSLVMIIDPFLADQKIVFLVPYQ